MGGTGGVKMQKTSKTIITLMTLTLALSLIGHVLGNGQEYETVGGEISQTSYITTFLVPALIIIGIFVAIVVLGVIHTKSKTDSNTSA